MPLQVRSVSNTPKREGKRVERPGGSTQYRPNSIISNEAPSSYQYFALELPDVCLTTDLCII
jgi:hypothetical protein